MTLTESLLALSFTIEQAAVGADGVRRSTRRVADILTPGDTSDFRGRITPDFRAQMFRAMAGDPRLGTFVAAPAQIVRPDLRSRMFRAEPFQEARVALDDPRAQTFVLPLWVWRAMFLRADRGGV